MVAAGGAQLAGRLAEHALAQPVEAPARSRRAAVPWVPEAAIGVRGGLLGQAVAQAFRDSRPRPGRRPRCLGGEEPRHGRSTPAELAIERLP